MIDILDVHVIQLKYPMQFGDQFAQGLRDFGIVKRFLQSGKCTAPAERTQIILLDGVVAD